MTNSFANDTKFCPCCNDYVRYLASVERSYCVECGGEVRLFSEADWQAFQAKMEYKKPKGGRTKKSAGRSGRSAASAD